MKVKRYNNCSAYTLVEVSVVIVIVGLLVLGLFSGQTLIENSKRTALIKDINKIDSAINSFYTRFESFPGDFNDASSYWPNCDSPATDCNGNADDIINDATGEDMRAWQHLALSEIYPGTFTGEGSSGANTRVIGTNIPKSSSQESAGYTFDYRTDSVYWNTQSTQYLSIGTRSTRTGIQDVYGPYMSGKDGYNLDKKFDDGNPSRGRFISFNGYGTATQISKSAADSCVDADITDNTSTVTYYRTADAPSCAFFYKLSHPNFKGNN